MQMKENRLLRKIMQRDTKHYELKRKLIRNQTFYRDLGLV